MQALGVLLLLAVTGSTAWWVLTPHRYKGWALSVAVLGIFASAFLILQDRAIELTIRNIGTLKAAAQQATTDAKAIAELREKMQAQSATVDLVALQSTKAATLAEELATKTHAAETKLGEIDAKTTAAETTLQQINTAFDSAKKKIDETEQLSEYLRTVVAAQSDEREAFDQLWRWAEDPLYDRREQARGAAQAVMDSHAPNGFITRPGDMSWKDGVDHAKFDLAKLRELYRSSPPWVKPKLIRYVWERNDIAKKDRLLFLVDIVSYDTSLNAVEAAGQYLSEALGANLKPLATQALLAKWEEKKFSPEWDETPPSPTP